MGHCSSTGQISSVFAGRPRIVLESEASAGTLSTLELDLETVDKFNLEVGLQHNGLGSAKMSWIFLYFGSVGVVECGLVFASNGKGKPLYCRPQMYFR